MWDGALLLLFLSFIMAIASFLAGSLPLSFSLSPRQLRLVTALGTGVLVGTSLIVIIPEGVQTLYGASKGTGHAHEEARGLFVDERAVMTETKEYEPHAWIGISLVLGFVLMYLIDTLPQTVSSPSPPQRFHVSLNQFSFNNSPTSAHEVADVPAPERFATGSAASPGAISRPSSTTVGLVIHAAADGIALGASSTMSSSDLSFIIFIALMIHKAPAAFGLTSVLLKQGLSKRMARAHLVVFSLAAPVGALLTWSAVHLMGFSSNALGESADAEFATGVLLLFSGGTFLYVAMHTMRESGSGDHAHGNDNAGVNGTYTGVPMDDPYGTSNSPAAPKEQTPSLVDVLATVAGMLLPLVVQWGHAH